jgi:N-acetyl-anhydromuramyl-L-alanine amidase AmpD
MIPTWLRRLIGRDGSPSRPKPVAPPPAKPAPPSKPALLLPPPIIEHYQQTNRVTPNVSSRPIRATHIILHHTSGSYAGSVAWCCDPTSRVSYHCIVSRTGKRTVLALPTKRTWHAGESIWQGRKNCNDFCIGLAWEGDTNIDPLSPAAVASAVEYLVPIIEDYHIPLSNIIRHADCAVPRGRKDDCSKAAHAAVIALLNQVL